MKSKRLPKSLIVVALLLAVSVAVAFAQDRYTLTVPNGLAFSAFRGYESWLVSISQDGGHVATILGKSYDDQGVPRRQSRQQQAFPRRRQDGENPLEPETDGDVPQSNGARAQHDVDFMVKDSKRFAGSGGWGWAAFEYDAASDTFRPATSADKPPQATEPSAGSRATPIVKTRDYVSRSLRRGELRHTSQDLHVLHRARGWATRSLAAGRLNANGVLLVPSEIS